MPRFRPSTYFLLLSSISGQTTRNPPEQTALNTPIQGKNEITFTFQTETSFTLGPEPPHGSRTFTTSSTTGITSITTTTSSLKTTSPLPPHFGCR